MKHLPFLFLYQLSVFISLHLPQHPLLFPRLYADKVVVRHLTADIDFQGVKARFVSRHYGTVAIPLVNPSFEAQCVLVLRR